MAHCTGCGSKLIEGAKFCADCGKAQSAAANNRGAFAKGQTAAITEAFAKMNPIYKKWWFWVIAVLVSGGIVSAVGVSNYNSKFAYTPASAEAMRGSDYASVESDFDDAGFEHVIVKKTLDGKAEDGKVVRVAVNGEAEFDREEKFRKDSEVIITYYEKPAGMPLGSDEFVDMPYADAVKKLKAAGFCDVTAEAVRDNQGDGETVTEVSAGGKSTFAAGDEFGRNDTIIVSYHALRTAIPLSSEEALALKRQDVMAVFQKAGFSAVTVQPVRYEDGGNDMVKSVTIAGNATFVKDDKTYADNAVVVTYFEPSIAIPFSSDEAKGLKYNDAVARLTKAGFNSVETDAVTEGEGVNGYVASISIDGKTDFTKDGKSYKDVGVVVGYWDLPYMVNVHVDFVGNLIFSKYDVDVLLDGVYQDTLAHGQDADFEFGLKDGTYTVTFKNAESPSVKGEVKLRVKSDAAVTITIYCYNDRVSVESKVSAVKTVALTQAPAATKAPAATTKQAAATEKPKATTAAPEDAIITAKNNKDFAEIMALKENHEPKILNFAVNNVGRTIEFDGVVYAPAEAVDPSGNSKTTRHDMLIIGNKSTYTPMFKLEDVAYGGSLRSAGEGTKFHIVAKIVESEHTITKKYRDFLNNTGMWGGLIFLEIISAQAI